MGRRAGKLATHMFLVEMDISSMGQYLVFTQITMCS